MLVYFARLYICPRPMVASSDRWLVDDSRILTLDLSIVVVVVILAFTSTPTRGLAICCWWFLWPESVMQGCRQLQCSRLEFGLWLLELGFQALIYSKPHSVPDVSSPKPPFKVKTLASIVSDFVESSVSLSQLPAPFVRGDKMYVKINEAIYQEQLKSFRTNLIGRLLLRKGFSFFENNWS